jgi:putative membrane protein
MKKFSAFFVMGMCIFGFSSFVAAQEQPGQPQESAFSTGEREFMRTAAEDGMFEVKLGKSAEEKATNERVKQFAQRMVHDHSEANEQLQALAKKEGVQLPQQLSDRHQQLYEEFAKSEKNTFDKQYMDLMVYAHEQAVAMFEKEGAEATNPELKVWVTSTLPVLQSHLQEARQIQGEISSGQAE